MTLDTWIYALPAVWDSLAVGEDEAQPLKAYSTGQTGFWKPYTGGFEVYNVNATPEDTQALVDALEAAQAGSVARVFSWGNMDGFDNLEVNQTIPAEVVAVMPDHITYDEDGNITSQIAATEANPNFAHGWAGQTPRIIAGDHNLTDFNEDFF